MTAAAGGRRASGRPTGPAAEAEPSCALSGAEDSLHDGDPDSRLRNLLPLPVPAADSKDLVRWNTLGRGSRRRILARHARQALIRDAVVALHELDAGGEPVPAPSAPRLAQGRSLKFIEDA